MAKRSTTAATAAAAQDALAALAGTAESTTPAVFTAPAGGGQVVFRPLDRLGLSPINERSECSEEEEEDMALSIREHGLLQNLIIYPHAEIEDFDLVAGGGRRWRGMNRLNGRGELPEVLAVHGIPCVRCKNEEEALVLTTTENLKRSDVHFLDRAASYARMRDRLGWSAMQIANKMGVGNDSITQYLRVHDRLDDDARAAARRGELNFKQAREMVAEKRESQAVAAEYYAGMTLPELHLAQADIDALTPAHRLALLVELDRRYAPTLPLPSPAAVPAVPKAGQDEAPDYDEAIGDRVILILSDITQIAETDIDATDHLTFNPAQPADHLNMSADDKWTLLCALRDSFDIPVGRGDLDDCGIVTVADLIHHVQRIVEAGEPPQETTRHTVPEFIQPGAVVKTSYGSGPYLVERVTGPHRTNEASAWWHPSNGGVYSLHCRDLDHQGNVRKGNNNRSYLNDYVVDPVSLNIIHSDRRTDRIIIVGLAPPEAADEPPAILRRPEGLNLGPSQSAGLPDDMRVAPSAAAPEQPAVDPRMVTLPRLEYQVRLTDQQRYFETDLDRGLLDRLAAALNARQDLISPGLSWRSWSLWCSGDALHMDIDDTTLLFDSFSDEQAHHVGSCMAKGKVERFIRRWLAMAEKTPPVGFAAFGTGWCLESVSSDGDDLPLRLVVIHEQTKRRLIFVPEQIDLQHAIAAAAPLSVADRVRKVLRAQLVMDDGDTDLPFDDETLAGDLNIVPADATDLGEALAAEFGFERPPFIIDPDGDTNLPDIGFNTVGDLVRFLEKRLAHGVGKSTTQEGN